MATEFKLACPCRFWPRPVVTGTNVWMPPKHFKRAASCYGNALFARTESHQHASSEVWHLEVSHDFARDVVRQKSLILSCMKSKTCRWKNVTSRRANLASSQAWHQGAGLHYVTLWWIPQAAKCCADSMNSGQSSFWRVYQRADAFNCHGPPQKCTCQSRGSKGSEKCGLERGMERVGTRIPYDMLNRPWPSNPKPWLP